ncbi:hypothetical protein FACS1894211_01710 [Clostridia bacterium]|nr:hypothetical protein FACS1894211_01710 [Clostridia bacterium]
MFNICETPAPVKELLAEYRERRKIYRTDKIAFEGAEGDVYNISAPFADRGETVIAGRVERRDSEISCVRFFRRTAAGRYAATVARALVRLQDPCVARLGGALLIGGTQIDTSPADDGQIVGWRTAYLKGPDTESLQFWRVGPHFMKDVRLLEYKKRLLVFTRPQGGAHGVGKIGTLLLDDPEDFNHISAERAKIHRSHFVDGEWGGANELHILKNGLIGVLGHIACMHADKSKHYYSMAFGFDPETQACSRVKIICERRDLKEGAAKRPDLTDVLFTGGLLRGGDGTAELYTGVSDAEAHYAVIDDPFREYELG